MAGSLCNLHLWHLLCCLLPCPTACRATRTSWCQWQRQRAWELYSQQAPAETALSKCIIKGKRSGS